jgi:UDP-N-acetylmuramoyl-L-alanyl-D-glutamate--2,6-diaminopimelate ligase
MLFTNLTAEHLDYHPGMEEYFAAKRMLFTDHASAARAGGKTPVFVVNARDPYGKKLLAEVKGAVDFAGDAAGFKTNLLGAFHLENVAGAVAMARQLGIPDSAIRQGLRELAGVPGRLERVKPGHPFEVIVDYAHKIDALEKVLDVLRPVTRGRILTVFGCGGDRDREKRPVMGRVACEKSGHVWVTSDNPRSEDPMAIISEIVAGTTGHSNFTVEPDRERAIAAAIHAAKPGDVVLIAGKGHETTQTVGSVRIPFDDRVVSKKYL